MTPAYERFLDDYRTVLRIEADAYVDLFDRALRLVHETGSDDPKAIELWDEFMALQRGDRPWRVRFNHDVVRQAIAIIDRGSLPQPDERTRWPN
jgi:hypothetical protein